MDQRGRDVRFVPKKAAYRSPCRVSRERRIYAAREPKVSSAADQAMAKLVELFFRSKPFHERAVPLRRSKDQTEFDISFESIIDEQFDYDSNSEYKRWVRRLYRLGLISRIPSEWELPQDQD